MEKVFIHSVAAGEGETGKASSEVRESKYELDKCQLCRRRSRLCRRLSQTSLSHSFPPEGKRQRKSLLSLLLFSSSFLVVKAFLGLLINSPPLLPLFFSTPPALLSHSPLCLLLSLLSSFPHSLGGTST